jgi:alginate O-acetyltransferase complex protein AlgI
MIFNTLSFAIFLAITLGMYWSLRSDTWRHRLLFAANLFFYGWWDWRFIPLLLGVIVVSYFSARLIQSARTATHAKLWLALACSLQLGLLGYFKYANFFLGAVQNVLERAGGHAGWTTLHIILPVGISFYIFQGISYVASVYEKRLAAEKNFVKLGVYLAFFPHLVAGPIIHATYFLPQLAERRRFDAAQFLEGCKKFAIGFLYKSVFADNLGAIVDPIFHAPTEYAPIAVFGGCLGFYGQIYFDFAGYSLMAIGVANFFGYLLPENFNHPYRAASMIDFWRRWHISLSTWLRDYLYIPLGGNRGSKWFQYRNIMITMLLGGLWHGASWNFIWWGAIHGTALCVNHAWRDWRDRTASPSFTLPPTLAWIGSFLLTQATVFLCWIPFRAQNFQDSLTILASLGRLFATSWVTTLPWFLILVPVLVDTWLVGDKPFATRLTLRSNTAVYVMVLVGMLIGLLFMHLGSVPFIYFRF